MPEQHPSRSNRRRSVRRKADLSIINEKQLLSAVLGTESILVVVLDLDGRIVMFNRACEKLTGVDSSQAIGRAFWEISNTPEESTQVRAFFQRLLEREFPETHDRAWRDSEGIQHLLRWSLTKLQDQLDPELLVAIGYDITEQDRAEQQLAIRTAQLTERVKELRCLYGIKRLGERSAISLDEFLQSVVELIPPAWQFPEYATAELIVGESEFRSGNYQHSTVCQQCRIMIENQPAGLVRVCYMSGFPGDEQSPFLEEEEHLLESVADAIGRVVANYSSRRKIADYQARLRSLASELALTGERERRRIARQLHDEIGHNLAMIKFRLGEHRGKLSEGEWEDLVSLIESSIRSTRTLTFELSPPVLHELGLGAALEWLSHQLTATMGIACRYEDDHQPKPLSENLRIEVFQIVRELLNNVGKHSQADQAWIVSRVENGWLEVTVGDNGAGFDADAQRQGHTRTGWGLFSIRERLANSGGQFAIDSKPGKGTNITLKVPLNADLAEPDSQPAVAASSAEQGSRQTIRILIADDQQLTRAGLCSLLEREPDMEVIGEAGTGSEVVRLCGELEPDVVVMDVVMPDLNGIEATRQIVLSAPHVKVIGLSMHSDGQYVLEMLRAGATGYLLKDCAQEDLAQAIRIVQANLTFLSPGLTDKVALDSGMGKTPRTVEPGLHSSSGESASLTRRETQVLVLLARGQTTKQIAAELGVSVKTVETHRQHVMEKLGDNSIAGLTRFAIQKGLIELD